MKYILICSFALIVKQCSINSTQPKPRLESSYSIVSYNVENLFDTWDEEFKFDDDFTPTGSKYWSKKRYEKKINDIGKVLVNISEEKVPAIIGLIEIENRKVLEDLLNNSPIKKFQYAIIHEDSPDERGIDVAILYDTDQFEYIDYQIGRIEFPEIIHDKTRDILIVEGKLGGERIFIALNHWPSRRGGASISEPKRIFVAKFLRKKVESLLAKNPEAGIIIMGDFNDTPNNKSIYKYLKAKPWSEQDTLINLMDATHIEGEGTYKYQNQWNMLDQFIVTKNLVDENGSLYITNNSAKIFAPKWLREDDPIYPGDRIFRTYLGPNYKGGYSDHFPIVLDLFVR